MHLTDTLNLALTIPVIVTLFTLMLTRKIVFGWVLDDLNATHASEIAYRDLRIAALEAMQTSALGEMVAIRGRIYEEMAPTLALANTQLQSTNTILADLINQRLTR
jgi:hypothetical protein